MTKLTLANVGSLIDATTAATTINSNSAATVAAIENTLSLDGSTPNQMQADLDMNSNRILNLPSPISLQEPLRILDANLLNGAGTITAFPIPVGGDTGQVLTKTSTANFDTTWKTPSFILGAAQVAGSNIALNTVTNANLAQVNASTLKGNPSNSSGNITDFTIQELPSLTAIDSSSDYAVMWDHVSNSLKKVRTVDIASSVTAGVSFINGNSGSFSLAGGITNSGNTIQADPVYHRGELRGCNLSNNTGLPNSFLDISSGIVCSDDFSTLMRLPSTYSKSVSNWTVGSGNGALDTGAVAINTWYHVFVISRLDTGVVDILFSKNLSPAMPTSYTVKRRVGSFKTDGSSNILSFIQTGDNFSWFNRILDFSQTAGSLNLTTGTLVTMGSLPLGIRVEGQFVATIANNTSGSLDLIVTDPLCSDFFPSAGSATATIRCNNNALVVSVRSWSNTSGQIRLRTSSSPIDASCFVSTFGYNDPRGKNV